MKLTPKEARQRREAIRFTVGFVVVWVLWFLVTLLAFKVFHLDLGGGGEAAGLATLMSLFTAELLYGWATSGRKGK